MKIVKIAIDLIVDFLFWLVFRVLLPGPREEKSKLMGYWWRKWWPFGNSPEIICSGFQKKATDRELGL